MSAVPEYVERLVTLPFHMRGAIQRWIEHGQNGRPGQFLSALLSNDLMRAVGHADEANLAALHDWAIYLNCYAPSGSYGSAENFASWRGIGFSGDVG